MVPSSTMKAHSILVVLCRVSQHKEVHEENVELWEVILKIMSADTEELKSPITRM